MPKLPSISGRELVRALERLGFEQAGQRGSHVKLRRGDSVCIVPLHPELKKGTLGGILRQAKLTSDDLLKAMTH
ncbi:type II toxin-antitoxin system HicA family toxin [Sphingomonas sp. DT-207]|uniref:type II toxin-antitoxin system HicA family toxin n=1 Tax=Sphingomonas sp. DT-207 TaxID=3396167 RepID=UPI003F1D30FF